MASKLVLPLLVSSAAAAAAIYASYYYILMRKNKCPTQWKRVGSVKKLYIFPLKSGRYIELQTVECTQVGFRLIKDSNNPLPLRDRSFVVYTGSDNEVKSGRHIPQLVNIEISVHDKNHIALDSLQMRTLYVEVPKNTENQVKVKFMSGETVEALDCGDEAAKWLSQLISQKDWGYRLAYHDASKRRNLVRHQKRMEFYKNMSDAATGLFSDVSSILILNHSTIREYLKKSNGANVSDVNFRPNIVVEDEDLQPYEEDLWDWLKIGDKVIMRNVKECTRCVFTTVDPDTGKRNFDKEPLTTLSKFRMSVGPENRPIMGIHTEVKTEGVINIGDEVYVGIY